MSFAVVVDEIHEAAQDVGIGLGKDAMAEVEDVARAAAGEIEDPARRLLDVRPRSEEEGRIEVALDGSVADERPAVIESDPPVEADDVAPGLGLETEETSRTDAEVR